jgi:hypothetical protein
MSSNHELPKIIEGIESEIKIHEKNIREYLSVRRQIDLLMNDLLPMRQYIDILLDIIKNIPRD